MTRLPIPDRARSGRPCNERGFSLVEAAIVLIVIGIILAAVLQGRSLIESAEYKSFGQQVREYRGAFHNFRDRYNALPGDFADASERLESSQPDGNGNGLIGDSSDGDWPGCSDPDDEPCMAWQHLRAAGMLGGNPDTEGGQAAPEHPFGGVIASFFTGSGNNGEFGHKLLIRDVPVGIAARFDTDADDERCDGGRITGQTCDSGSDWPSGQATVDVVYAL